MFYNAYVVRDHAATKPSTSSVNENENSLPAHTNTPSIDRLRRRSWSLDSKPLNLKIFVFCHTYHMQYLCSY